MRRRWPCSATICMIVTASCRRNNAQRFCRQSVLSSHGRRTSKTLQTMSCGVLRRTLPSTACSPISSMSLSLNPRTRALPSSTSLPASAASALPYRSRAGSACSPLNGIPMPRKHISQTLAMCLLAILQRNLRNHISLSSLTSFVLASPASRFLLLGFPRKELGARDGLQGQDT